MPAYHRHSCMLSVHHEFDKFRVFPPILVNQSNSRYDRLYHIKKNSNNELPEWLTNIDGNETKVNYLFTFVTSEFIVYVGDFTLRLKKKHTT